VVDLGGATIGVVSLDRRDAARPGHVRPEADEVELSYTILPDGWGCGYAAEACTAVLDWCASTLPDEPIVLCTQVANVPSTRLAAKLGFVEVERFEVERFEEYGVEQWLGMSAFSIPRA